MKKSRSTRSHFTHARSCSRALNRPLNQVPTRAKRPAFIRTYSLWQRDIFPYDRFTGYKKSNQNQFGRAFPFAFALTCNNIYLLYSSLSDFDSFCWRVHLSDGVCRLRARVQLKTLSSLLKPNDLVCSTLLIGWPSNWILISLQFSARNFWRVKTKKSQKLCEQWRHENSKK